jgi:hypothetical protein
MHKGKKKKEKKYQKMSAGRQVSTALRFLLASRHGGSAVTSGVATAIGNKCVFCPQFTNSGY